MNWGLKFLRNGGGVKDANLTLDSELRRRIKVLEERQEALETFIRSSLSHLERGPTRERVADLIKDLGSKVVQEHPNINYFNERFRDYELLLLNVKNLGYHLGHELYRQFGSRKISGPAYVPLTSRLCTQRDVESDWFAFWCSEMQIVPGYHRKLWELSFIAQVIYNESKLKPGLEGLGFGCGEEPLPSLFAKYGARILATDLDPNKPEAAAWQHTNQHVRDLESIRRREICPDDKLLSNIRMRYIDMNDIPRDLERRFDFCWSACALEHLGTIAKGLSFIENSLRTLKPGGVAVHTTEFNLHDGETIDNWATVLFQKRHFLELRDRLVAKGYRMLEMDFGLGDGVIDGFIDIPPPRWNDKVVKLPSPTAHLKLDIDGFACTSFALGIVAP